MPKKYFMKGKMKQKKFKTWSKTENSTWQLLAQRQLPNLENKVSTIWLDGFKKLGMSEKEVPDFDAVGQQLEELSQWQVTPTSQVFADGETWFQLLKNRKLLISDYIRPQDSLDYTPMPDVFHDAFGHLPFFANEQFSLIVELFTQRILSAKKNERRALGHLWWYSIEFGLIEEKNQIRALGAGLVSSFGEINRVFNGQTKNIAFNPNEVASTSESHHEFHTQLFVLKSLDQLEDIARNWTLPV